jgi:hypothetical protein
VLGDQLATPDRELQLATVSLHGRQPGALLGEVQSISPFRECRQGVGQTVEPRTASNLRDRQRGQASTYRPTVPRQQIGQLID